MRATTDHRTQLAGYRAVSGRFDTLTVPQRQYLMIDGRGDPNTATMYRHAIETIYPAAYRLRFFSRDELGRDYRVMPLEALWWSDDMDAFTIARDKALWRWTAMIMVPDWITPEHLDERRRALGGSRRPPPLIDLLRMDSLEEGLCVQTLHVGPYDDEAEVLRELHQEVLPGRGLRATGRHHEIYLSDARRTAPERLRTILRQPVAAD